jgi:uncharacterized protein
MKSPKALFSLVLFSNALLLTAQVNMESIDLRNNGVKLNAKFYTANQTTARPSVILLHGFPGNQSSPLGLAEKLNAAGFNILVFNYQGSYESEGTFSFDNCIDNAGAAVNFLLDPANQVRFNIDTAKIIVCGYSFGGTIAIESGIYNSKIRNIISIANDDHSVSIKKTMADPEFKENYLQFVAKSFGPAGPFRGDLKSLFDYNIQHVDRYDLVKNAEKLKAKKVLFLVGWQDGTSLIEVNTLPLYRKLQQLDPKKVSIKGFESDHRFGNAIDDITRSITDWISQNAL